MLKKIGISFLVIVALFLGYVAVKSPDYLIAREVVIQAPADKIFPYLNNSKLAGNWSPWLEIDPQAKMTYSGPDEGVGSRTAWDSEGKLGIGSATIVESIANEVVRIKLEYLKPFQMVQDAEYSVKQTENQSVVTWSVRGKNTFLARAMCTFMNMDKMVGVNFEKGLSNLKALVEKSN